MTEDTPLPVHEVNIANTRPALWYGGVPIEFAVGLIIATTELFVFSPLYATVMLPIWPAVILWIRHDYNIARVWLVDIRTSGLALDSHIWGGGSAVGAFPVKPYWHFRGIPNAR